MEELSSSATQLADTAQLLKGLVAKFKL